MSVGANEFRGANILSLTTSGRNQQRNRKHCRAELLAIVPRGFPAASSEKSDGHVCVVLLQPILASALVNCIQIRVYLRE